MEKLRESFFQRDTVQIAEALLSCLLVRVTDKGQMLKGRIVETEAYLGLQDDSCHSFRGRKTKRTEVMYRPGGIAYVYFTYGMHYCFNIVTEEAENPCAVLVRALEPLVGIKEMGENRSQKNIKNLTTGPAKLCQAMGICKKLNGESLEGDQLYIEKGPGVLKKNVVVTPRVGLSPTASSCYHPLRFYIKNNAFVSKVKV